MPSSKRSEAARKAWRERRKSPVEEIRRTIDHFMDLISDFGDYPTMVRLHKLLVKKAGEAKDWIDEEVETGLVSYHIF